MGFLSFFGLGKKQNYKALPAAPSTAALKDIPVRSVHPPFESRNPHPSHIHMIPAVRPLPQSAPAKQRDGGESSGSDLLTTVLVAEAVSSVFDSSPSSSFDSSSSSSDFGGFSGGDSGGAGASGNY